MWAKLLVNSTVSETGVELRRAHIDILERLSPMEARILNNIYSFSREELQQHAVFTGKLPDKAELEKEEKSEVQKQPPEEVVMALANLSRLGCLALPTTWDGGEIFTVVHPTVMGRSLVEACTFKSE
jgi:hypothetical protein